MKIITDAKDDVGRVNHGETPDAAIRPIQLHVIHDLGGGSATWLRDFCLADTDRKNLILKSFTHNNAMACGVALYQHVLDEVPLEMWHFTDQIQATVVTHPEYLSALNEIVGRHRVDALLVSSVIGHSLDVLNTNLPTVIVNHDYFPYCPAINIHFGDICKQCDGKRIDQCYRDNPKFNPFVTFPPVERVEVREKFLALVARTNVTMVVPSQSVRENFVRLDARFDRASFVTIPHGYGRKFTKIDVPAPSVNERLRILVLGQVSVPKGLSLLRSSLESLTQFSDVYLLGCGELGEFFKFKAGVHVFERYEIDELPNHVAAIKPHIGLLMSIVPETFSYALTELMMLEVPVAATRVGSFPERIRHHLDGYLYEPNSASLLATMKEVDHDRHMLETIRHNLRGWSPRNTGAMVADYHRLIPVGTIAMQDDLLGLKMHNQRPAEHLQKDEIRLMQSLTITSMWKEIKSLNLQQSMINQARQDIADQRDHEQSVGQQLRKQVEELSKQVEELSSHIDQLQSALEDNQDQTHSLNERFNEVLTSRSWKLTRPLRSLGHLRRRLKILTHAIWQLLQDPASLSTNMASLAAIWRSGGPPGVKVALTGLQTSHSADAWKAYRATFIEKVRPQIIRRIAEMTTTPTISILVPTFNTPESMLCEMLDSVKAQLYPHWELCVVDDGSNLPHVKKILEDYASADSRIKLQFSAVNLGVSCASNRALQMVTSEFVILLDHDDLLEEHALFRTAECILQDKPDVVYSDEVLVTPDLANVLRFAYRPAFSPEFLRSHPYIVHMVGFRTQTLRGIGGFDESLRISQDYDLILRATENAKCVVHIPDILYQWRILPSSAGELKMHDVMATSSTVLQRHLDRLGKGGTVSDGAGFNLFDSHYPLRADLSVAIVIPTKNHGELLRQCINSIRKTVFGIDYDIIVIDHDSDDGDTTTYLSSISENVRVLPYTGDFNFSAINNWAIKQLGKAYSHYLFCNNDIEAINSGWLGRMLQLGQQQMIGIVGARLLYPDRKTVQHAGVCVGMYGAAEHYGKFLRPPEAPGEPGYLEVFRSNHEVSAVTAACMLVCSEAFDKVGGFDESLAVGFGDVDLCLRVGQQGYGVLYCAHAELLHHESFTRGKSSIDPHPQDSALFQTRWRKMLKAGDPYFNPGLSLKSTSWHIADPIPCSFNIGRRVSVRDTVSGANKITS